MGRISLARTMAWRGKGWINPAFTLLMACTAVLPSWADGIRDVWKTVPDSVVPAIDRVRRLEMLDLVDYKVKAEVKNRLGSNSVMDTLTASYLHVTISASSEMAMTLLPCESGDTVVCVVKTYKGPEPDSKIAFYTSQWKQLDASCFLPFRSLSESWQQLTARPDTISPERYGELMSLVRVPLVGAILSADGQHVALSLSVPMLGVDDRPAVASIAVSRRLTWNGQRFVW
ncbi:MAG: DUF3256 family protein [Prevotella sp.]